MKKYIVGFGNMSIKLEMGVAITSIPNTALIQNTVRKRKLDFFCFLKELTAGTDC